MGATSINILMYHSISNGSGPTSIPPAVFRIQMDLLADCGYQAVPLAHLADWLAGGPPLPPRPVVITFDDGFADFEEHAAPVLRARRWAATVFLPTGRMGGNESWNGANTDSPRPLLSWDQVRRLAALGVDFGGHSVTHPDLTALSQPELELEVRQSREDIERQLGKVPAGFAPPYGASSPAVRLAIRKWFGVAVGTRLARADRRCDRYDLPRIEMHYFRGTARWRAYLEGRAEGYFLLRRALRAARRFRSRRWSEPLLSESGPSAPHPGQP